MHFRVLARALIALAIGAASFAAWSQAFPQKTVTWVVPYPAGGGSDFLARSVGEQLAAQLGQPVVVDNRPGAATALAAAMVAKAPADGYTMMSVDNATLVFNTALYNKLNYDPAKDFTLVAATARFPLILVVNPAFGVKNARELIARIKQQPGKFDYASPGAGSPHHLAMELFKAKAGLFLTHIPYRGAAPAVNDLLGNQVPMMFLDTAVAIPHIKAGKLVALGVASKRRLPQLPDVPTFEELGVRDFEVHAWQGVVVPAGTPAPIVTRLQNELIKAIDTPEVKKRLTEFGLEPTPMGSEAFASFVKAEVARWHALIKERHISLN